MKNYVLYGRGGHARVIADAIFLNGDQVVGYFDETNAYDSGLFIDADIVIAIGNNEVRKRIANEVSHRFSSVIHPSAVIASNVVIGIGTVILANAVIQSNVRIGQHCIINSNVVVDHDATIEDLVSIYPGTYIGGESRITKSKVVKANSVIERKTVF